MLVCGDCLYRYKHVKDFCPSCFKLYAMDDSMLPLHGATLLVTPAAPADTGDGGADTDGAATTVAVLAPGDSMGSGSPSATSGDGAPADAAEELQEPMEVDSSAEPAESVVESVVESAVEAGDGQQSTAQAAASSSSSSSSAPVQSANSEADLAEENMVCFSTSMQMNSTIIYQLNV